MRIALEVEYTNRSKESCIAEYPDLCAFEEKFNRSVLKLNTELRLSDLGFLAWHSMKRTGKHVLEYIDWSNTVSVVRATDEDTEIVPLER
jgi:hypothetical protein